MGTLYMLENYGRTRTVQRLDKDGNPVVYVDPRRRSPAYRAISPQSIVEAFADYPEMDVHVKKALGRTKWRDVVTVRRTDLTTGKGDETYAEGLSVLLDHSGRRSVRFVPYAVRLSCENQFTMPFWAFRHDSEEAWRFAGDPAKYMLDLMRTARVLPERLEVLRNKPYYTMTFFEDVNRGIHVAERKRILSAWDKVSVHYPSTPWGTLQSLTASKQPTLIRLASELVTTRFPSTVQGCVDYAWVANFVKGKAKVTK